VFHHAPRAVLLAAVTAALAVATPVMAAAGSHSKVAPHEFFSATVNGSTGEEGPVKVAVVCAGPSATGHPLAGQTVGVKLVPVPSSGATSLGYTGSNGTSIGAFFGAPPPANGTGAGSVNFRVYRTKLIPTSLVLPCSGSGHVTFVPLPNLPPAQGISIPVEFWSQSV
jgi:hypothetical protein